MFMWSATASESSRSIGPTSPRMRPRLSSSFVRSRGSSAISAVARSTSMARSYAGRPSDTVSQGICGRRQSSAGGRRRRFVSPRRFFSAMRRSRAARVGAVGTRRRGTASAARSFSRSRSVASSRLRSWLRSSCATARSTAPARASTRRFCTSESASDASTSNSASTLVDDFWACCPPGPLERETLISISETGTETERVTGISRSGAGKAGTSAPSPLRRRRSRRLRSRAGSGEPTPAGSPPSSLRLIDSRSMACILLDIDGVLHVSGDPIPGAQDAVAELRSTGHLLRFVTNNSTRARGALAQELREMGFELEDTELQTTSDAAARELEGKRVLALVMAAIVPDLDGLELVGDHADAVLVGGCDETLEPNQVFSYMNLARAFAEIQMGASFYCLHKNTWWQTSIGPMLDSGAFVAGLEYATGVEATVLGKPSPSYFAAALDALGAEPELTWLVTDDVEADGRGGRLPRHRRVVARAVPGPARGGSGRRLGPVKVGVDIIEIERIERALRRPGF